MSVQVESSEKIQAEKKKICPLSLIRSLRQQSESTQCLGNKCAVYIEICKPLMLTNTVASPTDQLTYEGCALVNSIPWKITRKPMKG